MLYANLDASGICYATVCSDFPVVGPNIVEVTDVTVNVMGKKWTGTEWVEVEPNNTPTT